MGIIDAIFFKYFGPVFIKEDSDVKPYIEKMKSLSSRATGKLKDKIDEQIAIAEAGLIGENNITYELKNSGMDMLVMHDLYLEKNGLSAQIDFLVITRKHIFVIECKNLYGNIEIDENGNFIRQKWFGKTCRKEGFPSPVSQNERHLNILKEIRREYKNNFLTQGLFDKLFPETYRSIVVLANPKTILDAKNAPENIRKIVIRSDQLIAHIKKIEDQDDSVKSSEKEMHDLLDSFIKCSKSNKSDYAKKYEKMLTELIANKVESQKDATTEEINPNTAKNISEEGTSTKKTCPKCGKVLVLRTAKKGANVGNQFWGCSGYPKCWYKEKINS